MKKLLLSALFLAFASVSCDRQREPDCKDLPRIIVSSDIGGTDADDNQSMLHFFMYSDKFDIEGIVSSASYGPGSKEEIFRMIDIYEQDYPALRAHVPVKSPDALRALVRQGRKGLATAEGYNSTTEGSSIIVDAARKADERPLWVLVWGTLEDVAQALHDAPDIKDKIRVYWIGGPNKKWGSYSYDYIVQNFPDLWMIENNSQYGGFIGNNSDKSEYQGLFYERHIAGKGATGKAFGDFYQGNPKMGDTPSLLYLMGGGDPDVPEDGHWGGSFSRMSRSTRYKVTGPLSDKDTVAVFSVMEWELDGPVVDIPSDQVCFTMTTDRQTWSGYYKGNGRYVLKYAPKFPGRMEYTVQSDIPGFPVHKGVFAVGPEWPGDGRYVSGNPNLVETSVTVGDSWWTDPGWIDTTPTSRHRELIMKDWAVRMDWIADPVDVKVSPAAEAKTVAEDYVGVSYESKMLVPNAEGKYYFSTANKGLLDLFKTLGIKSLRIGGSSTDNPTDPIPSLEDVDNFFSFVRAAGVKVIYSLRLRDGDPAYARAVASLINGKYRDCLDYFAIGNEPSYYKDFENLLHPHWEELRAAIEEGFPGARFCAPDDNPNPGLSTNMLNAFPDAVKLMSMHYYPGDCAYTNPFKVKDTSELIPFDPAVKRALLLSDGLHAKYEGVYNRMKDVFARCPYRLTETNSIWYGGLKGASDSFAAALWALDYMFWWAGKDCLGMNFHTGDYVGGGDGTVVSRYALFVSRPGGGFEIRPISYALELFAQAGKGALQEVALEGNTAGISAYACVSGKECLVTLINRNLEENSADRPVSIALDGIAPAGKTKALALVPDGESAAVVKFATGGKLNIDLAPQTAVLVRIPIK